MGAAQRHPTFNCYATWCHGLVTVSAPGAAGSTCTVHSTPCERTLLETTVRVSFALAPSPAAPESEAKSACVGEKPGSGWGGSRSVVLWPAHLNRAPNTQ
jgi:hypothetical protein